MSQGRPRFDGTPPQPSGLGKVADDVQRYKREWARKRRADQAFRDRENARETERKKLLKSQHARPWAPPWEIR